MNIQLLTNVIGHEKGKKILINAFQNNKLSHSYILSGLKGIGKYLLAVEFSKALLDNKSKQASPDLMVIQSAIENKKHISINIDEIRELESFLRFTSANNSYRIGIIDGIEYMSYSAANALLKILEEPGNKTIIFLITNSISSVIPTIRSRCINIKFNKPDEAGLINILKAYIDDEYLDYKFLLEAANYDVGTAIKIYKENAIEIIKKIENCFLTNDKSCISEVVRFAYDNKDAWEILKTNLIRCAYAIVKTSIPHYLASERILKKAEKVIDIINKCEKESLDKEKVIMYCLS
ncbi:MAG: hypothetical protein AB8V23_04875 [Candidatus Midichloria sp.]|uniref:Putative DNA polymerase III delta prime subunit DnaC n=1 Tax=Hyalomma marginatum TaxID=34627 RepID=A0A8S4C1A5_9ACAR|nr:putative DNA polymerase III delta prime subunit DnaC [Hyalomma marginatum]CAG7597993.1 putative DNA polymerase III delta prime subunit DnaC [Hyalomma marginatum]